MREDDVLLQIETDKVTIDVRYTGSEPGTVKEILVKEEDTVSVGQEVVIVETGNVPDDDSPAEKAPEPTKEPEKKAEAAPEKKAEPAPKPPPKKAEPKPAPSSPAPAQVCSCPNNLTSSLETAGSKLRDGVLSPGWTMSW